MQPRPRRIRDELLDHGWWLVPFVLLFWFLELQLPTPAPGPDPGESWHAVKGWELLTVVRLGIDSVSCGGRLAWFAGSPDLAQLFGWKFWGCEIALKLVLCCACALALLRTQSRLARLLLALALLALPSGLDALAFAALFALFQHVLSAGEERARGELACLVLGALLAQLEFGHFLLFAAGVALGGAALWAEVSRARAAGFLARALGSFLFVWMALGQSPLALGHWVQSSWWIASSLQERAPGAGLALAPWMLAALLALGWRRNARSQALRGLVLTGALLVAGGFGLSLARTLPDPLRTLRDLADPAALHQRISYRGGEIAGEWDLPRVRARVGQETIDVFQDSQGVALLNGLNYHPRPVFQSRAVSSPELSELNRAFLEGDRAPRFVLTRSEAPNERLAPAEDAQAFGELLLRYTPCFEERGWLLLERAREPVRTELPATLERRSAALGEWIELGDVPGDALELRLDVRPTARGTLEALLLRAPELVCEYERADGSRARARLLPGCARTGFLVRPWLETPAELARVFAGLPLEGLQRLRVLAAEGQDGLWEPRLDAQLVWRDGLLPPLREELALAMQFPCFQPAPDDVVRAEDLHEARQAGRTVQVFPPPAAVRWRLEPGVYQLTGTYGLLDEAWQGAQQSDGALIFVVLQQGREPLQLLRRLLDPARAAADRGDQPLQLEFEVSEPADLYIRVRNGWHEDATRDWVYWENVKLERF